jgi:hypothetical protein
MASRAARETRKRAPVTDAEVDADIERLLALEGAAFDVLLRDFEASLPDLDELLRELPDFDELLRGIEAPDAAEEARCAQCGAPIERARTGRRRRFCGDRCRLAAWRCLPR